MDIKIIENILAETLYLSDDKSSFFVWDELVSDMLKNSEDERDDYLQTVSGIVSLINEDNSLINEDTSVLLGML